ncbi:putative NAD(P)H-dependent oxidoreductase 1, partial [Mucuna pruriens]
DLEINSSSLLNSGAPIIFLIFFLLYRKHLVHWPGNWEFPCPEEALTLFDLEVVLKQMEECQKLGLTKCIGVSNFSCKKIENLLSFVEMNPTRQQKKLRKYCEAKGITIIAYSPLGSVGNAWGSNYNVVDNEFLKEIAEARAKSVALI